MILLPNKQLNVTQLNISLNVDHDRKSACLVRGRAELSTMAFPIPIPNSPNDGGTRHSNLPQFYPVTCDVICQPDGCVTPLAREFGALRRLLACFLSFLIVLCVYLLLRAFTGGGLLVVRGDDLQVAHGQSTV